MFNIVGLFFFTFAKGENVTNFVNQFNAFFSV